MTAMTDVAERVFLSCSYGEARSSLRRTVERLMHGSEQHVINVAVPAARTVLNKRLRVRYAAADDPLRSEEPWMITWSAEAGSTEPDFTGRLAIRLDPDRGPTLEVTGAYAPRAGAPAPACDYVTGLRAASSTARAVLAHLAADMARKIRIAAAVSPLEQHPFLQACRREPTPYTPVWLMRQAGRYLPEYRRIRARMSFLDLCRNSEAAAEVTVNTARRLGVDAAIVFADILLPLLPMNLGLRFEKGEGPQIERPVRSSRDVDALPRIDAGESLAFVARSIALARAELGERTPVLGFAGAPFTVCSYAVEGGSSRNFLATKAMMYRKPRLWHRLMTYVADLTAAYLNMQIDAGAQAVQLFDTWAGALSREDYRQFAMPYTQRTLRALRPQTPVIHFGTMTGSMLDLMREAGGDVIGLDWRVDLDEAWNRLGNDVGVQGNLDPVKLFARASEIRTSVRRLLERADGRRGYIFNLGHGVLPATPVDGVLTLIDAVHDYSRR